MSDFLGQEYGNLIILAACLGISAFFSASETAITSLGNLKVKHLIEKGDRRLRLWLDHPERVLTTILVFNNVVNILASSVTTEIAFRYFSSGAIGIATGVTTFLVLVFGEIFPKSFAKAYSERVASAAMFVIVAVYYIAYPLIYCLSAFANFAIRVVAKGAKGSPLITEEEIEFIVNEGEKAGVIGSLKKGIIDGAFDFDETRVREIMTPRTSLSAVSEDTPIADVISKVIATGHSRIPVYKRSIDDVVGVLLAKDLLNHTQGSQTKAGDLARETLFAPESKSIMSVFKDLKRSKSHIAIIIDEYGGTAGIVTMEDILEEIVGDIQDEYDAETAKILPLGPNQYEAAGSMSMEEFLEYFAIDSDRYREAWSFDEVDTLAGWITQLSGEIPTLGQTVSAGPFALEVLEVDQKRIERVRVRKAVEASADQAHIGR